METRTRARAAALVTALEEAWERDGRAQIARLLADRFPEVDDWTAHLETDSGIVYKRWWISIADCRAGAVVVDADRLRGGFARLADEVERQVSAMTGTAARARALDCRAARRELSVERE